MKLYHASPFNPSPFKHPDSVRANVSHYASVKPAVVPLPFKSSVKLEQYSRLFISVVVTTAVGTIVS